MMKKALQEKDSINKKKKEEEEDQEFVKDEEEDEAVTYTYKRTFKQKKAPDKGPANSGFHRAGTLPKANLLQVQRMDSEKSVASQSPKEKKEE